MGRPRRIASISLVAVASLQIVPPLQDPVKCLQSGTYLQRYGKLEMPIALRILSTYVFRTSTDEYPEAANLLLQAGGLLEVPRLAEDPVSSFDELRSTEGKRPDRGPGRPVRALSSWDCQ